MSVSRRLEDQFHQLKIQGDVFPPPPDDPVAKPIHYESTTSISSMRTVDYGPGGEGPRQPYSAQSGAPYSAHSGALYSAPSGPQRFDLPSGPRGYVSPHSSTSSLNQPYSGSQGHGYKEVEPQFVSPTSMQPRSNLASPGQYQPRGQEKGSLSPYAEEEYIQPASPSRGSYGSYRSPVPRGGMAYQGGMQRPMMQQYPASSATEIRTASPVRIASPRPPGAQSPTYNAGYSGERSQLLCTAPSGVRYGEAARSVPVGSVTTTAGDYQYKPSQPGPIPSYPYDPSRSPVGSPTERKPPYSPTGSVGTHPGSPGAQSNRSFGYPSTASQSGGFNKEAEVDALTNLLLQNMEASADPEFYGMCAKCDKVIMGAETGCTALDRMYHIDCFTCSACDVCLKGQPFFALESRPYCEPCYLNTLEKCSVCAMAITDRILRATGKPYHPSCFTCVVCGKSLDGIPFTVDASNQIHCIEDFHKKFAPRCCVCKLPITPEVGKEETVRVIAMDKSFHVGCYKCEDCGLVLSSEADGRGCYPLDDHILCKACNAHWIQRMTTNLTTDL